MPTLPLLWHPWSDNSRDGNTTQSQSEGAVRGDRHCPLRNQVYYNLLKTQGFSKAGISVHKNKDGRLIGINLRSAQKVNAGRREE